LFSACKISKFYLFRQSITSVLFFGNLGSTEVIIIALVVLLLFGGKKIPELMRGLGKGVSQFKKGMKDIEEEINNEPEQISGTKSN
jgi:sec-independent protein translocase protein TatA